MFGLMRETQAIIERVRRVSADLQQIDLSADRALAQLQPGQSLFASLTENTCCDPYLREQWIPVDLLPGRVVVEVSTERAYSPGAVVSLLSPVGRPIPLRSPLLHLLLIAEDVFPTPLVMLARHLSGGGVAVTLVLGGQAIRYPLEQLPPEIEIIRSDTNDWNWPEQVETLNWADQVIALAPTVTQNDLYARLYETVSQLRHQAIPAHYLCGLYYPRLACATGACLACQIPSRKETLLACADGPAFDLKEVKFL
jgi:NAD(P)H-flavin reductase